MLELNKNQKRLPIGGHHFYCHSVMFKGDTFPEVVKKMAEFRRNNNIAAGDPEQEILAHYQDKWPFMVVQSDREPKLEPPESYTQWRDWVFRTWKNPPKKFLGEKEATDRFVVCQSCPHFVSNPYWKKNPTPESMEVSRREFVLQRGIQADKISGFCALHLAPIGPMVFVADPKPLSQMKEGEIEPEACWVK